MASPEPIYQDILETAINGQYSVHKFDDRNFIIGRLDDGIKCRPAGEVGTISSFQIHVTLSLSEEADKKIIWKSNQIFVCFDETHISVGGISSSQSKILLADPDAIKMLSKSIDELFETIPPLDDDGS